MPEDIESDGINAPMILVLGQTGAGKSHFINKLAPGSCKESAHSDSCTQKPSLIQAKIDNKDVYLIDTPGFNDTRRDSQRSDATILGEIAHILAVQSELGVNLRGILYLHDILAPRMTGESVRQLEMLKRICGEENYGNIMLITTRWPDDIEYAKKWNCPVREGDLRRTYWKDMIRGGRGSTMWRFDDQEGTAKAIVRTLMGKKDVTLALQRELVRGELLQSTTAGTFVVNERQNDERRHSALSQEAQSNPGDDKIVEEADTLQKSIDQRKADEPKLKEDILETVRGEIEKVKEEIKKQGRRPTVSNVITWLIGMGSLAANIVGTILGAG